jgi:hypothetical protein
MLNDPKLTPRQREFVKDPRLREIIERLDLEVVESREVKLGKAIADRVDGWLQQIHLAPIVPRETFKPRSPWDKVDLKKFGGKRPF